MCSHRTDPPLLVFLLSSDCAVWSDTSSGWEWGPGPAALQCQAGGMNQVWAPFAQGRRIELDSEVVSVLVLMLCRRSSGSYTLLLWQLLGWMAACSSLPAVSRDGTGSGLDIVPCAAAFRVVLSSPHHQGQVPLPGHPHSLEISLGQKGAAALVTSMWHKGLFSITWPSHSLWGFFSMVYWIWFCQFPPPSVLWMSKIKERGENKIKMVIYLLIYP